MEVNGGSSQSFARSRREITRMSCKCKTKMERTSCVRGVRVICAAKAAAEPTARIILLIVLTEATETAEGRHDDGSVQCDC